MFGTHASVPDVPLSGPLGNYGNPIRTNGPGGQHDYLLRLRCIDGLSPWFERRGSVGIGPYNRMVDAYTIQCRDDEPMEVIMDMYHCVEETRPIDGFEIIPRTVPIRPFGACPDQGN